MSAGCATPRSTRERLGDGGRSDDLFVGAELDGRAIGAEHDVGIEQGEQRVEVAAA